jgi:hypothetical protein
LQRRDWPAAGAHVRHGERAVLRIAHEAAAMVGRHGVPARYRHRINDTMIVRFG